MRDRPQRPVCPEALNFKVGDRVRVTWRISGRRFGTTTRQVHDGTVEGHTAGLVLVRLDSESFGSPLLCPPDQLEPIQPIRSPEPSPQLNLFA